MGTINSFPINTRKLSEFDAANPSKIAEFPFWSGSAGVNLKRIAGDALANKFGSLQYTLPETLTTNVTLDSDQFFFLLNPGAANRVITPAGDASAYVANIGTLPTLTIGPVVLEAGESAFVIHDGAGNHTVVKITGTSGGGGGGGTSFVEVTLTDLADSTNYYYGGTNSSAGWQINKYLKSTLVLGFATIGNNPSKANLAAAWADRTTLTYL